MLRINIINYFTVNDLRVDLCNPSVSLPKRPKRVMCLAVMRNACDIVGHKQPLYNNILHAIW